MYHHFTTQFWAPFYTNLNSFNSIKKLLHEMLFASYKFDILLYLFWIICLYADKTMNN